MKKIILSANDMGMSLGVNEGIIDAYKNGLLSQASVLATSAYLDDALEKAKANPGLGISVHLDLSNGKPLLDSSWCLTDDEGFFTESSGLNHSKIFTDKQYKSVNLELRAQVDKLLKMGFKLSGLSTHKGFSRNVNLFEILSGICNDYGLVIRDEKAMFRNFADELRNGSILSCTKMYGEDVNMKFFKELVAEMSKQDAMVDLPFHPGICDKELMKMSIYNKQRENDLAFLKSKPLKKFLKDNNIKVTNYKKQ